MAPTPQDNPTPSVPPIFNLLARFLPALDKISLLLVVIGVVFYAANLNAQILQIALVALGATSFLQAYVPAPTIKQPSTSGEAAPKGMFDLLSLAIAPKVLWINSAILCVGIAFYLIQTEGFMNMLIIGAIGTIPAALLSGIGWLRNPDLAPIIKPALLRNVPLALVGLYLLMTVKVTPSGI